MDPFKEASRFNTQLRREQKRHAEAVMREAANHQGRILDLRKQLSPGAARLVAAAEQAESDELEPKTFDDVEKAIGLAAAEEPRLSANLMREVPPVPAGGIIETTPKARAR